MLNFLQNIQIKPFTWRGNAYSLYRLTFSDNCITFHLTPQKQGDHTALSQHIFLMWQILTNLSHILY